jgi:methionine synthase II (cobalamin-independent)
VASTGRRQRLLRRGSRERHAHPVRTRESVLTERAVAAAEVAGHYLAQVAAGPGVVMHSTNVVEHPERVADRLVGFAEAVSREYVVASID